LELAETAAEPTAFATATPTGLMLTVDEFAEDQVADFVRS
jgi:hypothetical protein